jgi:microcystin-dependent protein
MASVTGITADAMEDFIDASIVSGVVNGSGDLILTSHGGDDTNAGHVLGAKGDTGSTGATGSNGTNGTNGLDGNPAGSILMFGAASAPTGYHLCDGAAISRTTFATLFGVIGTTFGVGDGSTTFNVPNMANKFPRQEAANLAVSAGAATHDHALAGGSTTAVAHVTAGSSSDLQVKTATTASYTPNKAGAAFGSGTTAAQTTAAEVIGQTATASSLPPYLNLNFIIKT